MFVLKPLIAIAVVANLLPILPIVLQTVEGVPKPERRTLLLRALTTGNLVALGFAAGGGSMLDLLRVGMDDLRIAGGLILLVLAVYDLLFSREQRKEPLNAMAEAEEAIGLVPLGVPLMVGPATLATAMFVTEAFGFWIAAFALAVNYLANILLLLFGTTLVDVFGHGTMRATGKIMGLMVAGIAVSMIRTGIVNVWQGLQG